VLPEFVPVKVSVLPDAIVSVRFTTPVAPEVEFAVSVAALVKMLPFVPAPMPPEPDVRLSVLAAMPVAAVDPATPLAMAPVPDVDNVTVLPAALTGELIVMLLLLGTVT
jgi:hypothetical protein